MLDLLADSPLLVLFAVVSAGGLLGHVRIAGFSLGVAAVLFVGLAVGALDERLAVPQVLGTLGLVLFVYTVGLASGRGFVRAVRGWRGVVAMLGVVVWAGAMAVLTAGAAAVVAPALGAATIAGTYAGALTNTPALAAVVANPDAASAAARAGGGATVGYALTYPIGVLVPLLACWWMLRFDRRARAGQTAFDEPMDHRPERASIEVLADDPPMLADLAHSHPDVVISRVRRGDAEQIAHPDLQLQAHDIVVAIGELDTLEALVARIGVRSDEHPEYDRAHLTQRVVVVSNPRLAGRTLGELQLLRRHDTIASRIRRGDIEHVATMSTVLELGDRIKLVAPRDQLPAVSNLLGDSYRALRALDLVVLSLGIAIGMLIGEVSVPLPGGTTIALGSAGGPLVAGLALGILGRSGTLTWQLPQAANLALRQFGAALFLATVGTHAGSAFADTITSSSGPAILTAGLLASALATAASVVLARIVLRADRRAAAGMLAALHTQPAVFAFASEQAEDDEPVDVGYAMLLPAAMLAKIVMAQLLLR